MILWVRTPYVTQQYDPVDQPLAFDHRHHVRDDGIDCVYCHYEATRSPYAGVPPTSLCMNCHSQVWQESARLEPVRASWFEDRPIRWARVHKLPGFVYFDHSAHVSHGVGCVECHGRVDTMPRVFAVAPLTMTWCLDCHRDPDRAPATAERDHQHGVVALRGRAARSAPRSSAQLTLAPPVETCTGCHR